MTIFRSSLEDHLSSTVLPIFDGLAGAEPNDRFGVRVVNELASQQLFTQQLFLRPTAIELENHRADFMIAVPGLKDNPQMNGIPSEAFILLHLSRQTVLIGGSHCAREIKKSVSLST